MSRKILVVDDEKRIADTLSAVLSQAGYEVWSAYSGAAGLQKAAELAPDLLIADVVMPDINGVALAIAARKFLPLCRILLLSGQVASQEIIQQASAEGHCFELLAKPVHPRDLLAKLATIFPEELS